MMGRATLTLVLLVSCAHSMVHVYEISLPSVEQQIAQEYFDNDEEAGKRLTGGLSNAWRLMWGLGAIAAGWLVDRFGSRRLLVIYLWGCSVTCGFAALARSPEDLFLCMLAMGALASIYHPAGLALISHETSEENRPRALSWHGIFGSAGIGLTPLLAGMMLAADFDWRQVYQLLVVPGTVLGGVFLADAWRRARRSRCADAATPARPEEPPDWRSFLVLTLLATMQGFIYSALMSFLPRYLSQNGEISTSTGNYLASVVLLTGCVGQDLAGRWARHSRLERQLTIVTFGNVPLLSWMAVASGWGRPLAAALLALVHFMHQPLYNSLIAKYTPSHRRSLCYGFSFAMGLGLGSFGAGFAGISPSFRFLYSTLALTASAAGLVGMLLCWFQPLRESRRVI